MSELYDKLVEFFGKIDKKKNKLLTAVQWDLSVVQYKIGFRCLGLIHKLVTGPLWRKMAHEKHALDMSKSYKEMFKCFKN